MHFFGKKVGVNRWPEVNAIASRGCGHAIFLKLQPMNCKRSQVAAESVYAYCGSFAESIRERAASRAPVAGTSLLTLPRPKGGMPL